MAPERGIIEYSWNSFNRKTKIPIDFSSDARTKFGYIYAHLCVGCDACIVHQNSKNHSSHYTNECVTFWTKQFTLSRSLSLAFIFSLKFSARQSVKFLLPFFLRTRLASSYAHVFGLVLVAMLAFQPVVKSNHCFSAPLQLFSISIMNSLCLILSVCRRSRAICLNSMKRSLPFFFFFFLVSLASLIY